MEQLRDLMTILNEEYLDAYGPNFRIQSKIYVNQIRLLLQSHKATMNNGQVPLIPPDLALNTL